ncbi:hypothetical protein BKA81DRAFT_351239 [Phyllosticta paracitricarpa]
MQWAASMAAAPRTPKKEIIKQGLIRWLGSEVSGGMSTFSVEGNESEMNKCMLLDLFCFISVVEEVLTKRCYRDESKEPSSRCWFPHCFQYQSFSMIVKQRRALSISGHSAKEWPFTRLPEEFRNKVRWDWAASSSRRRCSEKCLRQSLLNSTEGRKGVDRDKRPGVAEHKQSRR